MQLLLTGATGFLGEYLLRELLDRDHEVWCLYRSPAKCWDSVRFLSGFGLPRQADKLHWLQGDLLSVTELWPNWVTKYPGLAKVDQLLHCAASMQLHLAADGEPLRTNVGSAAELLRLLELQPMQAHLVSTAYVCGRVEQGWVHETPHPRGQFVNSYEESKWQAEQCWGGQATILRPSIIVGDSLTGRCTSFFGWYIFMQAVQLLSRLIGDGATEQPFDLQLGLPVDASATMNIVPVDYVARAMVRLIENPLNHRRIFHLTHPNPPNYQQIWQFVAQRFQLAGIRFLGAGAEPMAPRNDLERMAYRQMESVLDYFGNNPLFCRQQTDQALPDLRPPNVTGELMNLWLDYAIDNDWGQ
jgi:thioester reductase-like protein